MPEKELKAIGTGESPVVLVTPAEILEHPLNQWVKKVLKKPWDDLSSSMRKRLEETSKLKFIKPTPPAFNAPKWVLCEYCHARAKGRRKNDTLRTATYICTRCGLIMSYKIGG